MPRIERRVDYGEWFTKLPSAARLRVGGRGARVARRGQRPPARHARRPRGLRRRRDRAGVPAGAHHARQPQRRLRRAGRRGHADPDRGVGGAVALGAPAGRRDQRRLRVRDAPELAQPSPTPSIRPGRRAGRSSSCCAAIPRTTVLVAPAGNQGSRTRQYPAAFGLDAPERGRRRLDRAGRPALDVLELRAVGRVLHRRRERAVDVRHELARARPRTPSRRASRAPARTRRRTSPRAGRCWSGTSFAAPKVDGRDRAARRRRARRRSRPGRS